MQTKTLLIILGVVAGGLLLCAGCGIVGVFIGIGKIRDSADRQYRMNELKQVALAAHNCYDQKKTMPATVDDLLPYLLGSGVGNRIRNGEIEVVWNALRFTDQPAGTTGTIYAWDTKAASNGMRLVVYMDGTAAQLTEAEFQSKPKAATSKKSN